MWRPVRIYSRLLFLVSPAVASIIGAAAQASSTQSAPAVATSVSVDVGMKFINQPIIPIRDPILNFLYQGYLPNHLNASCRSCVSQGSVSVVAGGYNPNDSVSSIGREFLNNGFIQATVHGVKGDFQTEINLLPGFNVASVKIPIFSVPIGRVKFGSAAAIDLNWRIFVPLQIQLNSEVDIYPSVKVEIPDGATVFINFADITKSYATGFNESKVTPGFDVNEPDLSFSFLEGIEMTLELAASNNPADSSVDLSGKLEAALEVPKYNTTITALNKVNGTCQTPQSGSNGKVYDEAISVSFAQGLDLSLNGELKIKVPGIPEHTWSAPDIGDFNASVSLDTCFAWDDKNKKFNQITNASAPTVSRPRVCMIGLVSFLAATVVTL